MQTSKLVETSLATPNYHAMVLLVDDQAMIAEVVRRTLAGESDIDFHYCHHACEALNLARQLQPTVILLDLVMPERDGLSVLREFRSQADMRDIPIVMLSTKEDAQTKSDSFSAGANDYLVKLPDRLELLARVRYHSRAFLSQQQRDEAYRALRESQQQLLEKHTALLAVNSDLEEALSQVKQLEGLLPICSYCKKIRDDGNYWTQIDSYVSTHSETKFSHGVCPECMETKMRPELARLKREHSCKP
jgi:two-component system chemotaxis family response regulator WspR